jgi:hypothetical protein
MWEKGRVDIFLMIHFGIGCPPYKTYFPLWRQLMSLEELELQECCECYLALVTDMESVAKSC